MAKKSAKKLVGEKDIAQSIEREFLSITNLDDARKIYYDYEDNDSSSAAKPEAITSAPSQPTPPPAAVVAPVQVLATPPATVAAPAPTASAIVDTALTPIDIVLALVAQKLRRAFDEVPLGESIQALSGGKLG